MRSVKGFIIVLFILFFMLDSVCVFGEEVMTIDIRHPLYDAKLLDIAIENANIYAILMILKNYYTDISNINDAKTKFRENPFIIKYIKDFEPPALIYYEDYQFEQKLYNISAVFKVKAFFSPTVVADYLGSFVAKRLKEEISIAYLSKLKKLIDNKKLENLWKLFPDTKLYLDKMEVFNFKLFLGTLREVILVDFHNLEKNLKKLLDEEKTDNEKKIELKMIFLSYELYNSIKNNEHPIVIIEKLDGGSFPENSNIIRSPIRFLALLSRTLKKKDSQGWIKPEEFKEFLDVNKGRLRELFIGLVYEKEKLKMEEIVFSGQNLRTILAGNIENILKINEVINDIIKLIQDINEKLAWFEELKEKGEKIEITEYYRYLEIAVDILETGFRLEERLLNKPIDDETQKYFRIARSVFEISKNINEKAYGLAFDNALNLIKEILDPEEKNKFLKYGTLFVNLALAKDGEEMGKALENAALPVGSYLIKRNCCFNISINAFPGFFLRSESSDVEENYGFTAPVGFAFSTSFKKIGSFSLYTPIFDLGAIVNWKLAGNNEEIPDLEWKDIFSPGLFIFYGFRTKPISIGIGFQKGPELIKITAQNDVLEMMKAENSWTFRLTLAVDIPIFNLINKERK